jgi:hypothetical protein
MALPIMDPPKPVDFASTERIEELYVQLSKVFANDVARRQQMGLPIAGPLPEVPGNLTLKRERPDDSGGDPVSKRRDTGESKVASAMPPVAPPIPKPSPPHPSINTFPPASGSGGASAGNVGHPSHMASPAMAHPSLPQGLSSTTADAQAAATTARERTKQMQLRQVQQQHLQQQQQQQQQQEGSRQMSPPSSAQSRQQQPLSGQGMSVGPTTSPNANASTAALTSHGPNAAQNTQILQNPNHPFVTYMNQTVPDFAQMPLQTQMQMVQVRRHSFLGNLYPNVSSSVATSSTAAAESAEPSRAAGWWART